MIDALARNRAIEPHAVMVSLPFRTPPSWIERAGLWLALSLGLTTMFALINLFDWAPPGNGWKSVWDVWVQIYVGVVPVLVALALASAWLPDRRGLRWPLLASIGILAAAVGWNAQAALHLLQTGEPIALPHLRVVQHTLIVLAFLVAVLLEYRRANQQAEAAVDEAEANRVRLNAELAASRLQLLQAQIEPHFLFNSLANVRRLLRIDGVAGRAMLGDLLRYLESALPRLRDDAPTLGREVELTRAFLAVHQVRMGSRLSVEFDVPPALDERVIPPMMLLTLVENALKHGLNPLPEGGAIRVAAATDESGRLWLSVADTGRGLSTAVGSGTGLVNIRTRLKTMFGSAADVTLKVNEPRGVVATLELPAPAR
jgi:signal transduction histidine kinase